MESSLRLLLPLSPPPTQLGQPRGKVLHFAEGGIRQFLHVLLKEKLAKAKTKKGSNENFAE